MKVTWLGTASVKIESASGAVLFDPFLQFPHATNPNSLDDYKGVDDIILTHGHFDHLLTVPDLLKADAAHRTRVWLGSVAKANYEKKWGADDRLTTIADGQTLEIGGMTVRIYRGKHAVPGRKLALKTVCSFDIIRYFPNLVKILAQHLSMPEGGQTLYYTVSAEGKTVGVMGSLGIAEGETYPIGADLLCLPVQGAADIPAECRKALAVLKPKQVMFTHFDNAFPPMSHFCPPPKLEGVNAVTPRYGETIVI
ncbi:MAG: MBL fold metallo-hydrolase [Clostridia bacterium]|nr:MBL fold metallo-hydrolase [Clostridia bacterium]